RGTTLSDLRTGRSLEEAYLELTRAHRSAARAGTRAAPPTDGRTEGPLDAPSPARAGPAGGTGRAGRPAQPDRRRQAGGRLVGRLGGRPLGAQLAAELQMLAGNGESLLLTLGIPVAFLLFFSTVHVLPVDHDRPVDFLVPGILALAVMATAMTALGIGTGFDRGYGVLKRLGATPLGRPRLLVAKVLTVVAVELVQAGVLLAVGAGLGWGPGGGGLGASLAAAGALVLGTVAFAGIGMLAAGTLRPLVNLAVCNMLFVVLMLLGGMLVPLSKLPSGLATLARALPAAALADALHRTLGAGLGVSGRDWLVLAVWAFAAPASAAAAFRWE
ncbi:MAG TPA: ABC transporter permease, partial [Acidimicrobiales bacterium]|nr:ABC transporter permease [Acidimicrobiales bacterium]